MKRRIFSDDGIRVRIVTEYLLHFLLGALKAQLPPQSSRLEGPPLFLRQRPCLILMFVYVNHLCPKAVLVSSLNSHDLKNDKEDVNTVITTSTAFLTTAFEANNDQICVYMFRSP